MAIKVEKLSRSFRSAPSLSGTIRPVDPFYRTAPDTNAGASLLELGKALEKIQPSITRFAEIKTQEWEESQIAEGRKLFEQNRHDWAEFVKAHPEQRGANPYLRKGYRLGQYAKAGLELAQAKMDAYVKGATVLRDGVEQDVRTLDDPSAFQEWSDKFDKEWMQKRFDGAPDFDATEWATAYIPTSQEFNGKLLGMHLNQRNDAYVESTKAQFTSTIGTYLETISNDPRMLAEGTDHDALIRETAATLQGMLNESVLNGMAPQDMNNALAAAVITAAKERGGESGKRLLKALLKVKSGTGPLGKVANVAAAIQDASDAIDEKEYLNENRAYQRLQRERSEKERQFLDEIAPLISTPEGARANLDGVLTLAAQKLGAEGATSVRNFILAIRGYYDLDARGNHQMSADELRRREESSAMLTFQIMTAVMTGKMTPEQAQDLTTRLVGAGRVTPQSGLSLFSGAKNVRDEAQNVQYNLASSVERDIASACTDPVTGTFDNNKYATLNGLVTDLATDILRKHSKESFVQQRQRLRDGLGAVMKTDYLKGPEAQVPQSTRHDLGIKLPAVNFTQALTADPKKVPWKTGPLFGNPTEFIAAVNSYRQAKNNPAELSKNPVVVLSKRLGITPDAFLVKQGDMFQDPGTGETLGTMLRNDPQFKKAGTVQMEPNVALAGIRSKLQGADAANLRGNPKGLVDALDKVYQVTPKTLRPLVQDAQTYLKKGVVSPELLKIARNIGATRREWKFGLDVPLSQMGKGPEVIIPNRMKDVLNQVLTIIEGGK